MIDILDVLSRSLFGEVTVLNILVFVTGILLSVGIGRLIRTILSRMFKDRDSYFVNGLGPIVYYVIVIIGTICVLPQLGVSLTELLKAGGDVTVYNILIFIIVVLLSVGIARLIRINLRRMLKDKVAPDLMNVLEKVVYYAVIITGFVTVLPQVGIDLTGLLVAGGIVGVVIGFASQSVVGNLISGLFLIFERPIKIGDQINVGDVSGYVEDIRVLSTIVRTYEGIYVRIPNEKVFSSNITNYVANPVRRFEYAIDISYGDDAEKAIEVITRVLEEHPFILKNPGSNVFVNSLAESGVTITVRTWTPSPVWYSVKLELLWKMKVELERAGITIPFPQRVVHIAREGNEYLKDAGERDTKA
jgi:small-conductance mechanosensitive channel